MKSQPLCLAASRSPARAVSLPPHLDWTPLSQLQAGHRNLCGSGVLKEVVIGAKVAHLVHYSCWAHLAGPDGYHLHGL